MCDGLGLEELRDQIQPAIGKAQAIEEHGHRCRPHADPLMRVLVAGVQILGKPDLPTQAGHYPQMIQPRDLDPLCRHGGSSC